METKEKFGISKFLIFVTFLAAVFVFITMFLDAAVITNSNGEVTSSIIGTDAAFGKSVFDWGLASGDINFNILLALGYLLPVIGAVLLLIGGFVGGRKVAGILSSILFLFFILSAVAMFTLLSTTTVTASILGVDTDPQALSDLGAGYELSVYAMAAGAVAVVGAVGSLGVAISSLGRRD